MRFNLSQNDFYTKKAKKEGYPARSVYKLKEIDEKFKIIKNGDRVLDLGAAPGSWLLYISQKIGQKGEVIGCDTEDLKIDLLPANSFFIKKSVFDNNFLEILPTPGVGKIGKFDAVVSDLAPQTSGIHEKDVALCLELVKRALFIAEQTLNKGGSFVAKLFDGADVGDFVKEVARAFKIVKKCRPQAIRKGSREFYLVAKDFVDK